MKFENKAEIGTGIYTLPDLARILNLEYHKVQRLLNEYWDKRFAAEFSEKYSWTVGKSKAVSFHTLVEFYIFYQLKESGVSTHGILQAHKELSQIYETPFPFAKSEILDGINCFGKKIVFEINNDEIIDLDSTKQLNLKFIKSFMHKLEFDNNSLAMRLYPLGKKNSVIVDPRHQFGQPTIQGTNLFPETIYNLYKKKESKKFIAYSYDISVKQVNDAIEYCKTAA
ncbi:DUF433 domain-containing protein [Arenibacter sp. F20364]|uniref:DUF433 domain-containing protein n=1 Tax=Arenibacter sp. F20364 TaxID=2926415 RepID=UPI001FF59169|nr:DUF433 domain-containing protein [Arenibacter sp. F20364]MCK0191712.1 DUF433 domain-containing protein [Arenibacter sp. F20364]